MSQILPFRRTGWPTPRRHKAARAPDRRRRRSRWQRHAGFIALAALMVAALAGPWQHERTHSTAPPDANTPSLDSAAIVIDGAYATVIDGDTLLMSEERIRLAGMDAPEAAQTCRDGKGRDYACGQAATRRLAALVAGGGLRCRGETRDRYGRPLVRCAAHGVSDLGETMVREGYAVSYYGGYAEAEADARNAARGLWGGTFERPSAWRRRHPRES